MPIQGPQPGWVYTVISGVVIGVVFRETVISEPTPESAALILRGDGHKNDPAQNLRRVVYSINSGMVVAVRY